MGKSGSGERRGRSKSRIRKTKRRLFGFSLVSLFNGISTFMGYQIPKPFSWDSGIIQLIAREIREFMSFPRIVED